MSRCHAATSLGFLATLSIIGCSLSPSYTPARAAATIVEVCREKFHLSVSTRLIGRTLYTSAQMPGFLRRLVANGTFATQDSDQIGNFLVTTTQVSLSTDPPIDFYVLRLSDPEAPGTELRYVTYLDDIRRLYANALAEMEFFDRRIQELKLRPSETVMTDPWMEREVVLGEFLAVQLALRIKAWGLQDAAVSDWHLEDCVGWFRNGTFSFTVARNVPSSATRLEAPWPKKALALMARVLTEYQFKDYQKILLTDASTMTTRQLTPADLAVYYKRR